jgi:DNA excision repair protein ERCC-2
MQIDLNRREVTLSVGEFATLTFGPSGGDSGRAGIWRAQLGQAWHDAMRERALKTDPNARFEISTTGTVRWKSWQIHMSGRIDQMIHTSGQDFLREVKTIRSILPAPESELRGTYASYFRQLAAYDRLLREGNIRSVMPFTCEMIFIDIETGVTQHVALEEEDRSGFERQLDLLAQFVERRRSGLERLKTLSFQPAFKHPREGQETIRQELDKAASRSKMVFFEAPTGYGKTGCILEYALNRLREGTVTRVVYLTGKSTGQLQVVAQLDHMLGDPAGAMRWQIRNKSEHCINDVYHCFRNSCTFLDGQEDRWSQSGLALRLAGDAFPRGIEDHRDIGKDARICPYEITRAALPINDLWIGDYNYVFSPSSRTMLDSLPGYDPAQTLLIIDEAHNLPNRVADSHSLLVDATQAQIALSALEAESTARGLSHAWREWSLFLTLLKAADSLDPFQEAEIHNLLKSVRTEMNRTPPDYSALGPNSCDVLFSSLTLIEEDERAALPRLFWCPKNGRMAATCLDAAPVIGSTVERFQEVIFLSATLSPTDNFAERCGLGDTQNAPYHLVAKTPWRSGAYDVAVDLRVDTRFRSREKHAGTTAATIGALRECSNGPVAAFFPSYAYARSIDGILARENPLLRVSMQQRRQTLAEQTEFLEESLALSDVLLLVLGSGFAEGIDLLGGRIGSALVAGPALPEVNAIQEARLGLRRHESREDGFRRVFQIPGLQKVNQALGRLVRAPGHRARVLLHCRRFSESNYHELLAPEYQNGRWIPDNEAFTSWLEDGPSKT